MLMGDTCTRGCRFCAIKTSRRPPSLDPEEPRKAAEAIASWKGVEYIVITSVDRDDMPDGGATHVADSIRMMKLYRPGLRVECLSPDFQGDFAGVRTVVRSGLDVFAHNVETVRRLQRRVRDPRAGYEQSLQVLRDAKRAAAEMDAEAERGKGEGEETKGRRRKRYPASDSDGIDPGSSQLSPSKAGTGTRVDSGSDSSPPQGEEKQGGRMGPLLTKSSLMLGLGETEDEVIEAMRDMHAAGVDILTLGQYLRPTPQHLPVDSLVHPDTFARLKEIGENVIGFGHVASGPLVRSSYKAGEAFYELHAKRGTTFKRIAK